MFAEFLRRHYLHLAVLALVAIAAAAAWMVIRDASGWTLYRSPGEPEYSVRYPKVLQLHEGYVDPMLPPGASVNAVSFTYPKEVLLGSKVAHAEFIVTPLEDAVCDARTYAPAATTTTAVEEKGVRYSYAMGGRNTATDGYQQRAYTIAGTPCFVIAYHLNFIANNDFDPDAPPSLFQGRTYTPGKVQYNDIIETFDIMRRSLNVRH